MRRVSPLYHLKLHKEMHCPLSITPPNNVYKQLLLTSNKILKVIK